MGEARGTFVPWKNDKFNPEYGDIKWKRRLNMALEAEDLTLEAIGYREKPKPAMQLTQENFVIFINHVSDELDCMAIQYDQDEDDAWTWRWREMFIDKVGEDKFMEIVERVGQWATQIVTIYPLPYVVEQYEIMQSRQIPDSLPEDWE